MIPKADGPITTGQTADSEVVHSTSSDPVRFAVQAVLAIYLMPLILVVCLIGITAVLAGKLAKIVRKVGDRLLGQHRSRPAFVIRHHEQKSGPRLIYRCERTRLPR